MMTALPEPASFVAPPSLGLVFVLHSDPQATALLLKHTPLQERDPHVAIRLTREGDDPLHVLLRRDGVFLGLRYEDELPPTTPITTDLLWEELQLHLHIREKFKDYEAAAAQLGLSLFEEMLLSGDRFSGEALSGLSPLQPLFHAQSIPLLAERLGWLSKARRWLLENQESPGEGYVGVMRSYFHVLHSVGHLWVFAGMGTRPEATWRRKLPKLEALPALSVLTLQQGQLSLALRASWCVGRLGAFALPLYQKAFQGAKEQLPLLDSVLGLCSVGLTHLPLWSSVRQRLATPINEAPDPIESARGQLVEYALRLLDQPENERADHLLEGKGELLRLSRNLALAPPYRFDAVEEVPDNASLALSLFTAGEVTDPAAILPSVRSVAALVNASPEDLYLPKDLLERLCISWTVQTTQRLLCRFEEFTPQKEKRRLFAPASEADLSGESFWEPLSLRTPRSIGLESLLRAAPDLTRVLLAQLPERPRAGVAIECDTDIYLVVSQEGELLMTLEGAPCPEGYEALSIEQWWSLAEKVPGLSARLTGLEETARTEAMDRFSDLLTERGDQLSLEEFVELERLRPFLLSSLIALHPKITKRLQAGRQWLIQNRSHPEYQRGLHAYWCVHHSLGHISLLAFSGQSSALFEKLLEALPSFAFTTSWGPVRQGKVALALRGFWSVSRFGEGALPSLLSHFHRTSTSLECITSLGSLAVLALHRPELRKEIVAAFHSKAESFGPPVDEAVPQLRQEMIRVALQTIKHPDEALSSCIERGKSIALAHAKRLSVTSPYKYQVPEQVPGRTALALFAREPGRLSHLPDVLWLVRALSFVSHAKPTAFYLPKDFLQQTQRPWTPKETVSLLRAFTEFSNHPEDSPSFKDLCPCGSGHAAQECCGQN